MFNGEKFLETKPDHTKESIPAGHIQSVTIFVDMDEVVASFINYYTKYADALGICVRHQDANRNPELFQKAVLEDRIFSKLEPMLHAFDLLGHLTDLQQSYNLEIKFLSSVNSQIAEVAEAAAAQKTEWLQQQGFKWQPIFVKHHTLKADYAHNRAILIDDNPACVDPFIAHGGQGILYTEFNADFVYELEEKIKLACAACAA